MKVNNKHREKNKRLFFCFINLLTNLNYFHWFFSFQEQDPANMGDDVINATKKALEIRYYLLPYLYTLFYRNHIFGETVARPLFFE